MLFALLYNQQDELMAAAPACDQLAVGSRYWQDFHLASVDAGEIYETAYCYIADPLVQSQLLQLGLDEQIDTKQLTAIVEHAVSATPMADRAA